MRQRVTRSMLEGLIRRAQKKEKMKTPLRYFEKLDKLTSYQDEYLLEYRRRVSPNDKKFIDRIDGILKGTPQRRDED